MTLLDELITNVSMNRIPIFSFPLGFKSSIQGCKTATTDKKLKGKDLKKCKTMEKKLKRCGHSCEEEKSRATQVIEKCGHLDRDFPGADLFHKMYLSIEACV